MKNTLKFIYKITAFILLFFLLGTLSVYVESIIIEKNTLSSINSMISEDDSVLLQNEDSKSYIPIFASLFTSYFIVFIIRWTKKKEI